MEVIGPIRHALADEHVVGVDPPLRPDQPGVWRRRINAFTGRAVSDKALTAEQDMRSGLQRLHGMTMTAGVVDGLAVTADRLSLGAAPDAATLLIAPGLGLARSGEDVTIGSTRRVRLGEIPVVVPTKMADALRSGALSANLPPPGAAPDLGPATVFERLAEEDPLALRLLPELPRSAAMPLAEALTRPAAAELPRAAMLVAQPVRATIVGRPRDDCPPDPRDDPYADLQRIDGCRLLLVFWPAEMVARAGGADYSLPPRGPAWRNQLAYRVFDMERSLRRGEMHPWEAWGVPLALLGFADDWTLEFVDRSAVVRKGGAPLPRTPMVPKSGQPQLWQARIEQLVEQLTGLPDLEPETLRRSLLRLPPAAVLPGSAFDPQTRRQRFFPGGFAVMATPIPRSELETAVRGAASLIPYNMAVADQVELLIPVPDPLYEPGLLQTAAVDPAFAEAIEEFEVNRAVALGRREHVRRRYDRLLEGVSGRAHGWPALTSPPAEIAAAGLDVPLNVGRTRRFAAGSAARVHSVMTDATLPVAPGDTIWFWLKIHNAASLTGLSLRLALPAVAANPPAFGPGVFWGETTGLVIASEGTGLTGRRIGDVPEAGEWLRLEVPADQKWLASGEALAGKSIAGIEWAQSGGDIEFGAFGKTDGNGNEIVWLADEAPGGAVFRTGLPNSAPAEWPWTDVPGREGAADTDFGTVRDGNRRRVSALQALKKEWSQPFLAEDMKRLEEIGLDAYLDEVEAKVSATNDAIDVGFIRARSDIYRVRQFMLGADSASRLVTSPSLADLAHRDEGARATSEGISKFIDAVRSRKANGIVFETPPTPPPAGAPAPAPAPTPTPSSLGNFSFLANVMTNNVAMASLTPTPTPATMFLAQPAFTAQPSFTVASASTVSPASSALASTAMTVFQPAVTPPTTFQPIAATIASPLLVNHISLASSAYVPKDVRAQRPLPGLVERTISVAERLKPSPAVQALEFAIASKGAVLQTLRTLMEAGQPGKFASRPPGVPLGDLGVPGFAMKAASTPPPTLASLFADQDKTNANDKVYVDLDVMIEQSVNKHESDYFTAAVNAIDNAIAMMRLVEGRIALYESLADRVRSVRAEVLALANSAAALLRSIDVEVAEARHDIATAQMLLEEETARVGALNARRAATLAEHVGVIGYRRVRECDARSLVPLQEMLGGLATPSLAACRRDHPDTPDELKRYTALLGDAPVKWFPRIAAEVERIDRIEAAREALEHSRKLASAAQALAFETRAVRATAGPLRFLDRALQAIQAQQQTLVQRRLATLTFAAAAPPRRTLAELHTEMKEVATLSDLSAGKHRNAALTAIAAAEISGFTEIASCLHAGFADVAPVVRLAWAEILSEFDRPADLRNLAGLPRWGELPRAARKSLQDLVDHLHSRIDRSNAKAVAYLDELVRVAMLLAAHAPVNRLISARLVSEAPARIGTRLTLAVDTRDARKGMVAMIRDSKDRLISKAVIDDIGEGKVGARIIANIAQTTTLLPTMRIELVAQVQRLG